LIRCITRYQNENGQRTGALIYGVRPLDAVSNMIMGTSFGVSLRRAAGWLIIVEATLLGMLSIAVLVGTWDSGPWLIFTLAILAVGIAPLLSSFIASRNPKGAARIALSVAPVTILFIFRFPWGFRAASLVFAGALVVPGLFWLLTSKRNWPLPIPSPMFPRRPYLSTVLGFGMLCALVVIAVLSSLLFPWWPPVGDCGGRPLLTDQGVPRNIDFTPRIVFVGPRSFHGWSLYSVARVEQRFTDLSRGPANLIILRGYFLPTDKSQRYFVEGVRSPGVLTRFLPIIEPVDCGRTAHLDDAGVALRVLHDGPPSSGGRLIGRVLASFQSEPCKPVPGVTVLAKGPAVSFVSVTDAQGIYDFVGLPPGHYTIEPLTTMIKGRNLVAGLDLKSGNVQDFSLYLE
jgi:hypothetical protein